MPVFQSKKIRRLAGYGLICLALFIISGCMARQPEPVKAEAANEERIGLEKERIKTGSEPVNNVLRHISSLHVQQSAQSVDIEIRGNQKLVYTSIKQSFPFGIAVYLPNTRIEDGLQVPLIDSENVTDIVVAYADVEQTTAKVEILLNEDLNYEMLEEAESLTVKLSGTNVPAMKATGEKPVALVSQKIETDPAPLNLVAEPKEEKPMDFSDKTARMTDIEFNTMEDGTSDIIVKTTHPVRYDIIQGEDQKLYLNLYNTIIPKHHERPILTYYFKSAVESLMPMQMPGKEKDAKIEINTRDQVPFRVVQDANILSLYFEASRVEPPVFGKAKKKIGGSTGNDQDLMAQQPQMEARSQFEPVLPDNRETDPDGEIFDRPKTYTGEKIKLDFFETDIKNVFRILRSVGGLNFAIDDDVQGKVTLTLDNPVPWDQVLDLVLKMNNLGQKKEGNVIRIATLESLDNEEKLRQAAIESRKKSLEQRKSLEPLTTEYIPINYSDADSDIKPHISQILTKDRGTLSVDNRTNMIIITDTQEKIGQAKEIIFRLDKVTPQIMIEAKVVEVTKNFSKELGIGLALSERNEPTAGETDFTIALNQPITASNPANTGTFNFFRLFGSSLTQLNAQIAASEVKGDVRIVSSPRILTLDNKKAKIKQGLEFAYLERDDSGGSSVKFKSIDLLLEVTPHVTPDNRISMNVYLTKNDIDDIVSGVPSLSTNEAETELLVNDNDTVVIGGIVKTTDNKGVIGTPVLSGIPILGRLFRKDTNVDNRNELLIFITPSIVQLEQKENIITGKR